MATKPEKDGASTPAKHLLSEQTEQATKAQLINEDLEETKVDTLDLSQFNKYLAQFDQESVKKTLEKYVDNDYNQRYPRPFIVDTIGLDWHNKALPNTVNARLNFKIRMARMLGITSVGAILLMIASRFQVRAATIIGSALLLMFTVYFCIILSYVFRPAADGALYRIYSISHRPQGWISLNSGYIQLLYKNESIQSISELSAINGGVTKTMLHTLGAYTWSGILVHLATEIYWNSCVFEWDRVDSLEFVGAGGLLIISIFELDPFRPWMKMMHYVGAGLGCCTIAGYVIQQYYIGTKLWFSVVIAIVAGVGFISWILVGFATDLAQCQYKAKYDGEMKKCVESAVNGVVQLYPLQCLIPPFFKNRSVNAYSRMNIGFEALFLYLGALSLCLWLFDYDESCDVGCAGSYDGDNTAPKCYV